MHVSYEERNDSFVRPNHASSSGETSASTTGTAVPISSRPNSLVDDVRREYHQMISSGDSRRMADSSSASEDEVHERSLDNSDPFQDGMATRMGSSAKVEFVAAPTVVQPPHLHRQPPSHIHVPSSLGITTPEPPGSSNHTLHNDEAKSGAEAADGDDDDGFGDFEEAAVAEHSFARGTTNSIGSLNPDPPFSLAGDGEVASLANTTRTITNASLFSNDSTTAVGAIRTWAGRQPLNVSARGSKQQQLPPHLQHSHLSQSNKNNNSTSASAEDAAGGDFFPLPAYAAPVAVTPLRRSNPDAPENKNFWSASPSLCGVEASESQWGTMMMMDGTNGRLGSPLSSRFGTAATNAKGSSSQDEGSSDLYSAEDGTVNLAMVAELNHCRSRRTSPQHPRSAAVDAARLRKCFGLLLREAATKPTAAALASPAHVAAEASSPTLSRVAQSSPHRTNLNHSQYTTHAPSVGATYFSSLLTSAKDEDSVTRVFEALAFTRTATATATTAAGAEAGATTAGRPHSTATRSPVHGGGGAASVVGNDSLWFAEAVPAENSFAGEGMWQGSPRCGAEGQLWSCQELTQQTGGPGAVDADADDDDDVVPTVAVSPAESSHSCSASAGDPSHAGLVHPEHRLLQYLEHEWQKRRSLRSIGALA